MGFRSSSWTIRNPMHPIQSTASFFLTASTSPTALPRLSWIPPCGANPLLRRMPREARSFASWHWAILRRPQPMARQAATGISREPNAKSRQSVGSSPMLGASWEWKPPRPTTEAKPPAPTLFISAAMGCSIPSTPISPVSSWPRPAVEGKMRCCKLSRSPKSDSLARPSWWFLLVKLAVADTQPQRVY